MILRQPNVGIENDLEITDASIALANLSKSRAP